MTSNSLSNLTIRSAVVREPGIGNILACDPKREDDDPHAYIFKWEEGKLIKSTANFNGHSICLISAPESALVFVSEAGEYGVHYKGGSIAGDIFEESHPPAKKPRLGGIRSVSEIAGKAYAVGFGGIVYRMDRLKNWTRIDEGLPITFEIEAIHGFSGSDIYTVGDDGEMWHYGGKNWSRRELPTNENLSTVRCAGDDKVFAAGQEGVLLRGIEDTWETIEQKQADEDIWDLEWFKGHLYVSTMDSVYRLTENDLEPVDFGDDTPKSCYQLSSAKGVMWSVGEHDIMAFDGRRWTRVV